MSTGLELDRFLAELSARRAMLLELADATAPVVPTPAELLEELRELSEQLIVADEELRSQQEELDATRQSLLTLSADRDLLLAHSSRAFVLTDERGVVLQATQAVRVLTRQPSVRLAPRPIATWFSGGDRRLIRRIIGDLVRSGQPQQVSGLQLAGAAAPLVDVTAKVMSGPEGRRIRWELVPQTPRDSPLWAGPDANRTGAVDSVSVVLHLSAVAVSLDACESREELLRRSIEAAVRLVPGARHAGVVLTTRDGNATPAAASSNEARVAEARQLSLWRGPLPESLDDVAPVVSRLEPTASDGPEPGFGTAVSVPLVARGECLGALTVYAAADDHLDETFRSVSEALAALIALALRRQTETSHLREAVRSHEEIGQAVGLLVERHGLRPEDAFAALLRQSQHSNVKLRAIARSMLEQAQQGRSRT